MSETAPAWLGAGSSVAIATVAAVRGARIDVKSPSFGAATARSATVGPYAPRVGDDVLVAATADGARFVIGVLRALREVEPAAPEAGPSDETARAPRASLGDGGADPAVRGPGGSRAALERDADGEVLRVRDGAGRLLFEHREGKSVVHVPEGDLELRAPGDVALTAGGAVRLEGRERVVARADGPVELASSDGAIRVDRDRATVEARHVSTEAERAEVRVKEAHLVAGTLRSVVHRVRERAEVVERTAGRVVERAREVYRDVEELSQTRAGRLKLVADRALTALGRSTLVKAREDVKIKGDKIYLA